MKMLEGHTIPAGRIIPSQLTGHSFPGFLSGHTMPSDGRSGHTYPAGHLMAGE
jgi:hypothetical protein